jgi:hypothetical protein
MRLPTQRTPSFSAIHVRVPGIVGATFIIMLGLAAIVAALIENTQR